MDFEYERVERDPYSLEHSFEVVVEDSSISLVDDRHLFHKGQFVPKSQDGNLCNDIEERFRRLVTEWLSDPRVRLSSIMREKVFHPAYLQIIGLGPEALPLLFSELEARPNHWFWALKAVTGVDPVSESERGNLKKMTAAWLKWAEQNGITW